MDKISFRKKIIGYKVVRLEGRVEGLDINSTVTEYNFPALKKELESEGIEVTVYPEIA